jgi:uncharacterized membrane protein YgcG
MPKNTHPENGETKHATSRKRGQEAASFWLRYGFKAVVLPWLLFWIVFWIGISALHQEVIRNNGTINLNSGPKVVTLTRYFNDMAGLFPADQVADRFEHRMSDFERETSNQIAVAVYANAPNGAIEDFTIHTADLSRLGHKGLDNGAILFVFMDKRIARLEVGLGLEGVLTDADARRILDELLGPRFTRGEYDQGIDDTLSALTARIRNEYHKGQIPSEFAMFYRRIRLAIGKAQSVASGYLYSQAWDDLRTASLGNRIAISLLGTFIGMWLWAVAKENARLINTVWRWVRREPGLPGRELRNGEATMELAKTISFAGFFGAVAVGFVVVAGGGTFEGAGALIHW